MKIDIHVHTTNSKHKIFGQIGIVDAVASPLEMVRTAKHVGLGAICITDHNKCLGIEKAKTLSRKTGITVISGIEQSIGRKELIILNTDKPISGVNLSEVLENAKKQNTITIACHPNDLFGRGFKNYKDFDAVEVLNGFGTRLKNTTEIASVGGSDAHAPFQLGSVGTIVDSESSIDDILTAIEHKRCRPFGKPFNWKLPFKLIAMRYSYWLKH